MKIKFLLVTSLVFLFVSSVDGQIDWKAYQDPDGSFTRWSISPDINFLIEDARFTEDKEKELNFNFRTDYTLNNVRNLSQFSSSSTCIVNYSHDNSESTESYNAAFIRPIVNLEYTKYFKQRRGFFVRADAYIDYLLYFGDRAEVNESNTVEILLGKGRLENIAPVYQAIRIHNQYNKGKDSFKDAQQEGLFHIAKMMRQLDYNNTLDTRMRSIERNSIFLEKLEDAGYALDNYYDIANMLDAYTFERPGLVTEGYEYYLGGGSSNNLINDNYQFFAKAGITFNKALNEKWHFSNSALGQYLFDTEGFILSLNSTLRYFPSARTSFQFRLTPVFSDINALNSSLQTSSTFNYFVSPYLSWIGRVDWTINNIGQDNESGRFSINFGITYYLI